MSVSGATAETVSNDDRTLPTYRRATLQDAPAMVDVERAAHSLLAAHEVRLDALSLPSEVEESKRAIPE
jgi:hypothetical protein